VSVSSVVPPLLPTLLQQPSLYLQALLFPLLLYLQSSIMSSPLSFNIDNGYLEGIVRGYRAGLLTPSHYASLTQCDTLDDFRMQLQATDYGNFLANEPSPISTSTIAEKATRKLVNEFDYLRSNATKPLSRFLDYMT